VLVGVGNCWLTCDDAVGWGWWALVVYGPAADYARTTDPGTRWLCLAAVGRVGRREIGVRHINAVLGLGRGGGPGEWPPAGRPLQPLRRERSRRPMLGSIEFTEGWGDEQMACSGPAVGRPLLRVSDDLDSR
jgi:hypothetical protein